MTPRQKATASVGFDVVGGPAQALAQKADEGFDPDNPPEEFADAIEADDFLIYGKASIEQHDVEGQRISVKALENALDRFFDSQDAPGIISRGHADVPVGMPVREHTLESDTTLVIDGETYEFDAGETIRTEPKDADGDQLPELWLVSRLANDSDIARETRYKALLGELNGYSVTVKPHSDARRRTDDGEDILSVDLHAVTVGTDEAIRNKGSEFDVAEFKALAGTVGGAPVNVARAFINLLSTESTASKRTGGIRRGHDNQHMSENEGEGWLLRKLKSGDAATDEQTDGADDGNVEQKADDEDEGDGEMDEAEQEANPIDTALEAGTISAADASNLRPVAEKMDDGGVQTLVDAISENDLDVADAVDMIEAVGGGDMPAPGDDEKDSPEELKAAADADDDVGADDGIDEETVAALEEKLDTAVEAADRLDEIEQKLNSFEEQFATGEDVEQKVEQKLDSLAEGLDSLDDEILTKAEFDDLVQKSEVVTSPTPTADAESDGTTLGDVVGLGEGGD